MKILDAYRLFFTPLSPIHIGTGESYEPTNYVIDDGTLHEFDTGAIVDALAESDRKELLAIASRRPNEEMIKAIQKYFHDRRAELQPWAIHRIPVLDGVARLYSKTVGQTANLETGGQQVINRLEIDRAAYNPINRHPVLFGSSIKGAIRTALLDGENKGAALQTVQDKRSGKNRKENNLELQQRLFKYRAGKFELDPMRLVQLSDAVWEGGAELPTAQVFLAVNRKKAPVRDAQGRLRASEAETGPDQILECVPALRHRAFAGQLNVQSVAGINAADKLPDAGLRFDMQHIGQACNAFYHPILLKEMSLLRERGYLDEAWAESVERILQDPRLQSSKAFLLCVGRHSGAEAVTLCGVRDIKIMLGRDPETKKQRYAYEAESRTLWLAGSERDQQANLLPFGWLLVEIAPMAAGAPAEYSPLKAACSAHLETAHQWARAQAQKRQALEAARRQAEMRRREEEEKVRRAAEDADRAVREEAERRARLAAMSANLRRVEEFVAFARQRAAQLRGGKERLNAEFHNRARKLAQDALEGTDWTAEERFAVAEAIAEWLPKVVERIDKDQLKKLKLGALRGGTT